MIDPTLPGSHAPDLAALAVAKHPRTPLSGPYGHPFHPGLVAIPIGTWIASIIFDIVAMTNTSDEAVFAEGAYWLIGIGIIGALVAALFGLLDLTQIKRGTRTFATGLAHMTLNLVAVALFVADFLVRRADGYEDSSTTGFVLSLIAIVVLGVSGWLGGQLAYRYGVRVADEQHQADGWR